MSPYCISFLSGRAMYAFLYSEHKGPYLSCYFIQFWSCFAAMLCMICHAMLCYDMSTLHLILHPSEYSKGPSHTAMYFTSIQLCHMPTLSYLRHLRAIFLIISYFISNYVPNYLIQFPTYCYHFLLFLPCYIMIIILFLLSHVYEVIAHTRRSYIYIYYSSPAIILAPYG